MFLDNKFYHPDGRAKIFALPYRPPAEEPCEKYPIRMTNGRVVYHYLTGNQTRRIKFLNDMATEQYVDVHLELAKQYDIEDDEKICIFTRRSRAFFKVMVTIK